MTEGQGRERLQEKRSNGPWTFSRYFALIVFKFLFSRFLYRGSDIF